MKKIMGVLLIGLLGFLGCSDNDNATRTVGQATPVAPFGITDTTTPTFEWLPVPGATQYHLLVEDIREETQFEEWYTAEEGACDSGDGQLCTVNTEIDLFGDIWKVRACEGDRCGPWSRALQFSFAVAGPEQPRFTDNGDDTITDNNTTLMWTKSADLAFENFDSSRVWCAERVRIGDWDDWRLPNASEISSLIDHGQRDPALPQGYPFYNVRMDYDHAMYWTTDIKYSSLARRFDKCIVMYIFNGDLTPGPSRGWNGRFHPRIGTVWCVRSSQD